MNTVDLGQWIGIFESSDLGRMCPIFRKSTMDGLPGGSDGEERFTEGEGIDY